MILYDLEQRTDEWLQIRAGKITASRISDLLAMTKSGTPGASRKNYIAQLVCERLTGEPSEAGFVSKEMLWGIEYEDEARAAYEFYKEVTVRRAGFATHPLLDFAGCSPDGLVGDDGGTEIKCPNTATHIETILTDKIPGTYWQQIQWSMDCCEREWWDYVSYDPRPKLAGLTLYVQRVHRDEKWMLMAREEAVKANTEIDDLVSKLMARIS